MLANDGYPNRSAVHDGLEGARFVDASTRASSVAALNLTMRLTEDLQDVARALARQGAAADRDVLRVQSEALMALSQTVGATRLYLLAEELHDRTDDPACPQFATPLAEMRTLLHQLILSVQATRNAWLIRP